MCAKVLDHLHLLLRLFPFMIFTYFSIVFLRFFSYLLYVFLAIHFTVIFSFNNFSSSVDPLYPLFYFSLSLLSFFSFNFPYIFIFFPISCYFPKTYTPSMPVTSVCGGFMIPHLIMVSDGVFHAMDAPPANEIPRSAGKVPPVALGQYRYEEVCMCI